MVRRDVALVPHLVDSVVVRAMALESPAVAHQEVAAEVQEGSVVERGVACLVIVAVLEAVAQCAAAAEHASNAVRLALSVPLAAKVAVLVVPIASLVNLVIVVEA